ncbi:MAG TPA: DnaA/Hda family protein [Gemmatimonadaceae bacterium]|nr:DnaA/Hda family protein [Gemmatimonadaceae bacterium]
MTAELDPRYRFENYIVGAANRLAVSAAKAVAQSPGTSYNPLFIYSSSGLGKTHLMIAVGHLAMQIAPALRCLYITLDEFVEELTAAVSSGTIEQYKQRFQDVDVLLLDDVQFLAGRRETQSEMLRLFNALQRAGKQIILTSDRPPNEIADLDERLITRFSGGLVVDVGLPDYETRVAILRAKAEERGAQFEAGVLDEVARMNFGNVRELQGALNRLIASQTLGEAEVTVRNVREILGEKPDAAPAAAQGARGQEFASFLSDLSDVVAQHIDTWRVRVVEAITYWHQLGYETTLLERALEQSEEPDVDALLAQFEANIARLRALEQEAARIDPVLAESELFKDPERVGEAELMLARQLGGAEPPPGPDPALRRETFEVGPSNQLAVHAADTVALEPGRKYNPLFLYGTPGVGVTHLVHALANELAAGGGARTVACVNAQQFIDELITALQEGTIERWRARYRLVDALLIDDVQLCAGTERAQEELFHVFNSLYSVGKQLVLAADRAPKQIAGLEERLRSRFEGGLVVEIQPPDHALREKLYARFLAAAGQHPDRVLVDFLSARAVANVPELVATVDRLVKAAEVVGVPLNAAFARKELDGGGTAPMPLRAADGREADAFFLDEEKVVWDWPDVSGRAIEDLR